MRSISSPKNSTRIAVSSEDTGKISNTSPRTQPDRMQPAIKKIEEELEQRVQYFKKEDKLLEAQRIAERTNFELQIPEKKADDYLLLMAVENHILPKFLFLIDPLHTYHALVEL